jgi:hypothetical protein
VITPSIAQRQQSLRFRLFAKSEGWERTFIQRLLRPATVAEEPKLGTRKSSGWMLPVR